MIRQFTPKIGYPTKWRDYSALEIRRDDVIGNAAATASSCSFFRCRVSFSPALHSAAPNVMTS